MWRRVRHAVKGRPFMKDDRRRTVIFVVEAHVGAVPAEVGGQQHPRLQLFNHQPVRSSTLERLTFRYVTHESDPSNYAARNEKRRLRPFASGETRRGQQATPTSGSPVDAAA